MSVLHSKSNRRILPRWRSSDKATYSAEFSSASASTSKSANYNHQSDLRQAINDFEQSPSVGTAAELITTSVLSNNTEVAQDATTYILQHENEVPHALLNLVKAATDGDTATATQYVTRTRILLRIHQDNPLLWADMARHYAGLGNKRQSYRCMQTALSLAPNHRWMLRAAARSLVHQDEATAAHKLLSNHPRTRNDSWLIAAELACAHVANRPPKYWRQAYDIVKRDTVAPIHISELATAIAMMELESGDHKKARKNILKGLVSPTENTLAQIYWAKENRHLNNGYRLDEKVRSATDAYEADYRQSILQGDFLAALASAETWCKDEPFAARPKYEMAYIASLLDDYALTEKITSVVAQLDGYIDPGLEMNKTFATISSGRLSPERDASEIEKLKSKIIRATNMKNENAYHAMANLGLWHYRFGNPTIGRECYQTAIRTAQKQNFSEAATMAAIFAAREAILSKSDAGGEILNQATELVKKSKFKASEFYLRKLEALQQTPDKALEILSPASATRFLETVTKAPQYRIEKTEDGIVLWVSSKLPPPKSKPVQASKPETSIPEHN